jgi:hypothetical protein
MVTALPSRQHRQLKQCHSPAAWEVRNCRQVGEIRRGAGPSPTAARIRRMVPPALLLPRDEEYLPLSAYCFCLGNGVTDLVEGIFPPGRGL